MSGRKNQVDSPVNLTKQFLKDLASGWKTPTELINWDNVTRPKDKSKNIKSVKMSLAGKCVGVDFYSVKTYNFNVVGAALLDLSKQTGNLFCMDNIKYSYEV